MKIGTTFDFQQAESLGLDWRKAFQNIIKMKFNPIRVGIKWNVVEVEKGVYDWSIYDEIFEYLTKVDAVLVVGAKVPRWPEYFIPDWIELKGNLDSSLLEKGLQKFILKVVDRYGNLENVKIIQIENEPFLKSGPNQRTLSLKLLEKELETVKKVTQKPILLTMQGLPTTGVVAEFLKGRLSYKKKLIRKADIVGFNVFPSFEGKVFERWNKVYKASKLAWKYLKYLYKYSLQRHKEVIVTELQAEPWQFGEVSHSEAFGNKTCNPELVKDYLKRVEKIGFEKVLVWGSEFWLKCKEEGANDWIEVV